MRAALGEEGAAAPVAPELDFEDREIVLRVDFDDVDDERCLWTSLHFMRGPRHPVAREWVYLLDSRGRGCMGQVESVTGWLARVRPL
jgi:hypothetical protein